MGKRNKKSKNKIKHLEAADNYKNQRPSNTVDRQSEVWNDPFDKYVSWMSDIKFKISKIEDNLNRMSTGGDDGKKGMEELKAVVGAKEKELADCHAEMDVQQQSVRLIERQFDLYRSKVLVAEDLQPSADKLYRLIEFLQSLYQLALSFYNEQLELDPTSINIALTAQFLAKYNISLSKINLEKWSQITYTLKESGCITDIEVIRLFTKQRLDLNDQIMLFQNILYREILQPYTHSSVLLYEELRQLDRFGGANDEIAAKAASVFDQVQKKLLYCLQPEYGLRIQYLPLFEDYNKYGQMVRVMGGVAPSALYRNVEGLGKNYIIEIKQYGIGWSSDEEIAKTEIVIKK
jgi:hypothetical protein